MIHGVRFSKEVPTVGNLYSLIKNLYQPTYLLLNDDYYIDCTEEECDAFESAIKTHYKPLGDGWVCWDAFLINKYLSKMLTSTPFTMYNEVDLYKIPKFKEFQWVIAFNIVDSNVADLFTISKQIYDMVKLKLECEDVEFPGLFSDPMSCPMY